MSDAREIAERIVMETLTPPFVTVMPRLADAIEAALLTERERWVTLLQNFLDSGVEFDDPRIDYVTIQVNRVDIEDARKAIRKENDG